MFKVLLTWRSLDGENTFDTTEESLADFAAVGKYILAACTNHLWSCEKSLEKIDIVPNDTVFGLYDPDGRIISLHRTKEGAEKQLNKVMQQNPSADGTIDCWIGTVPILE